MAIQLTAAEIEEYARLDPKEAEKKIGGHPKVGLMEVGENKRAVQAKRVELGLEDAPAPSVATAVRSPQAIEVINAKLQRLLDGYLDQAIDQVTYKSEKNKLTGEKVSLEQMITSLAQTQSGWIEPMEKWINQAGSLIEVAECDDLLAKKVVSKEIFGSNLRLSASEASGTAKHPWDFVQETKNSLKNRESFQNRCDLERVRGITSNPS